MPKTFTCPTCGGPLHVPRDGGDEPTIQCEHCGNTVIVPEALRVRAPASSASAELPQTLDLNSLLAQAGQFGEVAQLVKAGKKIEAIKLYRELTGVGLKEAKDAVEQLAEGKFVQVSQTITRTRTTRAILNPDASQAALAEVRHLMNAGHKIEAIKVYRQHFGVGLKEAKDAVEALDALDTGDMPAFASAPEAAAASDPLPDIELFLCELQPLLQTDQKIEAIKRLRQKYAVGLKDAKDAVEELEAGLPTTAARTVERALKDNAQEALAEQRRRAMQSAGKPGQRIRAGWGGCLAPVIFIGVIFGVIFWGWPLRTSKSFQQALDAANSDPRVRAAFGGEVERGWGFITGRISCGDSCSANYSIPIQGPTGAGEIRVISDTLDDSVLGGIISEGTWELDAWVTTPDGARIGLGASADLFTPEVSATPITLPTLTLAEVDATAGAIARATRIVEQTATAEAQAHLDETATAQAQTTREAQIAATQMQATAQAMIATQTLWRTTVISETFKSNANFWPTQRFDDGSLVLIPTIEDEVYRWTIQPASGGHYWNILPGAVEPADDFVASVDARLVSGGESGVYVYGLAFRAEGQDYGFFGLTNTGNFRVLGVYGSSIYQFYDFESAAIRAEPGATNRLTVRAIGPDFVFEINGQTVFTWNQPDLNDGRIGLGADIGREGKDAVIEFDNFEVTAP